MPSERETFVLRGSICWATLFHFLYILSYKDGTSFHGTTIYFSYIMTKICKNLVEFARLHKILFLLNSLAYGKNIVVIWVLLQRWYASRFTRSISWDWEVHRELDMQRNRAFVVFFFVWWSKLRWWSIADVFPLGHCVLLIMNWTIHDFLNLLNWVNA